MEEAWLWFVEAGLGFGTGTLRYKTLGSSQDRDALAITGGISGGIQFRLGQAFLETRFGYQFVEFSQLYFVVEEFQVHGLEWNFLFGFDF